MFKRTFPQLSEAKTKEDIFTGPDIRKVIHDFAFERKLCQKELGAWKLFVKVVNEFLSSKKEENYKTLVEELLRSYQLMGCQVSLKIHFLISHINFFLENLSKRFH